MKKTIITLVYILFFIVACKEDSNEIRKESVIYVDDSHISDFDNWLYETFTKPYNIEVKWKWDDTEIDNAFHVTPPRKEKAEQFMKALYKIWISPYEKVGGEKFIKTYVPKLIYLVGTPQFNEDGTKTLGLAEGGRKVTIFNVDSFNNTDLKKMTSSFHTMHHEFAHILHQKIAFSTQYKALSKGSYTGAWYNFSEQNANTLGFISPYSMLNENEDFVEVVATILSTVQNSNSPVEKYVPEKDAKGLITGNIVKKEMSDFQLKLYMFGIAAKQQQDGSIKLSQDQAAPIGLSIMLEKIKIIKKYYKQTWGIDLFELQGEIEKATNELILENS